MRIFGKNKMFSICVTSIAISHKALTERAVFFCQYPLQAPRNADALETRITLCCWFQIVRDGVAAGGARPQTGNRTSGADPRGIPQRRGHGCDCGRERIEIVRPGGVGQHPARLSRGVGAAGRPAPHGRGDLVRARPGLAVHLPDRCARTRALRAAAGLVPARLPAERRRRGQLVPWGAVDLRQHHLGHARRRHRVRAGGGQQGHLRAGAAQALRGACHRRAPGRAG